ncbi:GFA family protein [Sphingomicrobium sp. XHP0235]|uniref:GFA family protein n=1 Tax=Sphingomicrobium aquimarinum TaxID=3133971 RepID=UPI0031FF2FE6
MSERYEGSCRCGAVRFAATGSPLVTMACHCRGCQQMTGGAFSLSSLYPWDKVEVLEGQTVRGGLGTGPDHQHCAKCHSWLWTTPDGLEGYANVRSSQFDDAAAHRPFIEVHLSEALPGATGVAQKAFDGVPDAETFPKLFAAYAEWDERA